MMMKSSSVPLASLNSRYFEDYSILNYSNHVNPITRTSVVPWDQPLPFAHVHHLKCVFHSLPLHKEIIFQWSFLTSLVKSIRSIFCFDNILIIISFVRTNLSRAPEKASHIYMIERKEKVLASLRDKMS